MDAAWTKLLPRYLRARLVGRLEFQSVVQNSGWMAVERLVRLVLGMPVTILVARYLGPDSFGLLSYAIAFVAIFAAIATAGLDRVVIREIARDERAVGDILGTAFLIRLLLGAAALLAAYIASTAMQGDPRTHWLVLIIAAGMLFQATDVIDYWNQSQLQSKYTVQAKATGFIIASAIRVGLILTGAGVVAFAVATAIEIALGATILLLSHLRRARNQLPYGASLARLRFLLQESWPLLFAAVAITLYMRVDMVMLQSMVGAEEVGIYAAATRLSEAWYAIPVLLGASIFPAIVRLRENDKTSYLRRLQQLYAAFFWMAFLIIVPLWFLSNQLVDLLYGASFAAAGPVLAVHVIGGIPVFLGVASSQFLLAENLQRISMYRTMIGLIANVALNLLLIPSHGALGAAIATVISYFISTFSLALFPATRSQAWRLITCPVPRRPKG